MSDKMLSILYCSCAIWTLISLAMTVRAMTIDDSLPVSVWTLFTFAFLFLTIWISSILDKR